MKTVLHLSSSSGPGGAERVVCSLAASLDVARFRSLVVLFRPGWLKDECEKRGLETMVFPGTGTLHWRWMRDCYRLIRKERVDMVHAHEFDAIVHGTLVAKLARVPIIATVHGKNYYWEKTRRRWAYRLVSRNGKMVAVSHDLKRFLVQSVGIREQCIDVIHNGIELPAIVPPEEAQACRAELGVPPNAMLLGTIGSLYPVKAHRFLLEAMVEVLARHPATVLILVGRGDQEIALQRQARDLGIERQIRFVGLRHDVPRLLAAMDLFVLPSLSEGLSIALLEAMAAARPVLASNVGGNPEIIRDGQNGWLVPAGNVSQLAERLCQITALGRDHQLIGKYAAAGQATVQNHFSIVRMSQQYQQIYESVKSVRSHSETMMR